MSTAAGLKIEDKGTLSCWPAAISGYDPSTENPVNMVYNDLKPHIRGKKENNPFIEYLLV